jgi:CBS domain-containing protein
MRVAEAMTPAIATVDVDATAAQAAAQMKARGIGLLGVMRDGELYGVVTDRDIALRGVAAGLDPTTTRVRELMSPGLVSCQGDSTVEDAARAMADEKVRRLIVRDGLSPVGVLSLGDIAARTAASSLVDRALARICSEP